MSIKTALAVKISTLVTNVNSIVEELIRRSLMKNSYLPALAGPSPALPSGPTFDLKEIFEKGIFWCPTPKHRTSAEKKLTKRFTPLPNNFITKYSVPKTNIITCLECGSHHERGNLCGTCYEKVKLETQQVQEEIFKRDEFKYNYPTSEIKVLYQDENKNQDESSKKVIVEVPKKRPSWFNGDLITKVTSKAK